MRTQLVAALGLAPLTLLFFQQLSLVGFVANLLAIPLVTLVITPLGNEEEESWEGCLSVPGLRGVVPRFKRIRYQGFDAQGQAMDRVAEGFHARVVQHECDHLWGKLYPMRVRDFTRFGFTEVLFPGLDAGDDD